MPSADEKRQISGTGEYFSHQLHRHKTKLDQTEQEINCSEYFKLHKTEIRECFIANSLYSSKPILNTFDHLPLRYSNLENYERSLEIEYFDDDFIILKAFIHSPEELPFNLIPTFRMKKAPAYTYIAINVVETINEKDVEDQPVSSRNCRFPEEYVIEGELGYSLSTCKYSRQMKEELKECNCTLPIGPVPNNAPLCGVFDYECVAEKTRSEDLQSHSNDPCQVPTCVGMEIITIGQFEEDVNGDVENVAVFKIDILNKPNSRYIRRVSITRLDMTGEIKFQDVWQSASFNVSFSVQVGGIVGLFIGASILTFVEIIFLVYDICKQRLTMNRERKIARLNERRLKK